MIHYLHIAYHGSLKNGNTFDGDILVAIEKCTIVQLRECLKEMLINSGIDTAATPTITSMTELNPKLFRMLYGNKEINILKIEE